MFITMANGEALNFRIKSYDTEAKMLADTPSENTIGVEMTGSDWFDKAIISGSAPENPDRNVLWIQIDGDSPVSFLASKNSNLYLQPYKCYLYKRVNDVEDWHVVVSHFYKDSKWNVFGRQYLYRTGKFNDELTGGFMEVILPFSGTEFGNVDIKAEADHLLLDGSKERWGSAATKGAVVCFDKNIDLTNYKTLTFKGVFDYENANSVGIYGIWATMGDYPLIGGNCKEDAYTCKEVLAYSTNDVVLNVSGFAGEYLVGIGIKSSKVRIDECYLEM